MSNLKTDKDEADQQNILRSLLADVDREGTLPAGGTELILLEIDPHRAHVCWNIDPGQSISSNPLILRVYDISESGSIASANQSFDVEIFGLQGRWYLDLWRDDRTFVAQIGYLNPDGSLRVLAESNSVKTPPAEPIELKSNGGHVDHLGNPLHTEWPGDAPPPLVESAPGGDAPMVMAESVPATLVVEPVKILDPNFPVVDWPPGPMDSETLIEHAAKQDDHPVETAVDAVQAAGDAAVAFAEEIMTGDEKTFPGPEQLIESFTEHNEAIQAFYDAVGHEHAAEQPAPHVESPANQPEAPSSPPHSQSAPLEQIVGLSSNEHASRDVLLEVHAELHIYGRSKPNTELTLYGQIVKTRPDGSFSVRRPLPHGAVILPLLYTQKGDGHPEV
jgi:Domain of unknown function (DUF4912)